MATQDNTSSVSAQHPVADLIEGVVSGFIGGALYGYVQTSGTDKFVRAAVLHEAKEVAKCCGVYSITHSTMFHLRKKEDYWNPLVSAAAAAASTNYLKGPFARVRAASGGAAAFGLVHVAVTTIFPEKYSRNWWDY